MYANLQPIQERGPPENVNLTKTLQCNEDDAMIHPLTIPHILPVLPSASETHAANGPG